MMPELEQGGISVDLWEVFLANRAYLALVQGHTFFLFIYIFLLAIICEL
jgi:hypothetical protein